MMLKNVELEWLKLDPNNPDMGFDGTKPQYQATVVTRDKAQAGEWKKAGLNVKPSEDDSGMRYHVQVKKMATKKDGSKENPPAVINGALQPLADTSIVGNGSKGNVKLRTFEYNYNGRTGTGFRLDAIQVTDLVKYEGKAGSSDYGFEKVAEAAADTSNDDEDLFE